MSTMGSMWSHRSNMHDSWSIHTNSFLKDLHCCAICGVTKMGYRRQQYRLVYNSYIDATMLMQGSTLYGATNAYLANFTTNASGYKMIICTQCHSNKNKPPNAPYVVYNSLTYMRSIITTNPLHVQMLSFFEIGMHIQSKYWGFSVGKIVDTSLLSNPLFGCATRLDSLQSIEHWASSLSPLLSQIPTTNTFFQTYVTIFEQPHKNTSMCILTPDVIQQMIRNATLYSMLFSHMDVPQEVYNLALLFDMRTHEGPKKHVNFH